jgi:hypothetical protein
MCENEIDTFKPLLEQYKKGSLLKIELKDYYHSCSDGCCSDYGTITTVNGIELPYQNQDVETILRQVLEHLGYIVEIQHN